MYSGMCDDEAMPLHALLMGRLSRSPPSLAVADAQLCASADRMGARVEGQAAYVQGDRHVSRRTDLIAWKCSGPIVEKEIWSGQDATVIVDD